METLQQASRRYTERSFEAFLEGRPNCTENWLRGVVGASSQEDIQEALESLALNYGDSERFGVLRRACEVA